MKFTTRSLLQVMSAGMLASPGSANEAQDMNLSRGLSGHADLGTFWSVYNVSVAAADDACIVEEGESVPDSCCASSDAALTPHKALQGENMDSCFSLGPGLVPFSGCVGEGVYGYGEDCTGEGAPFMAASAEECGCNFVIEGSGCYKANDLPGQQWFVYLDASICEATVIDDDGGADDDDDDDDDGASGPISIFLTATFITALAAISL